MKSISITPFYRKSKENILPTSEDSFRKGKEAKYRLLSTYVHRAVEHTLITVSLISSCKANLILPHRQKVTCSRFHSY